MVSKYQVITASSAEELTRRVNQLMERNNKNQIWEIDGSHQVVETHRQNRYRGTDPIDTIITREYSQTMKNVIE